MKLEITQELIDAAQLCVDADHAHLEAVRSGDFKQTQKSMTAINLARASLELHVCGVLAAKGLINDRN